MKKKSTKNTINKTMYKGQSKEKTTEKHEKEQFNLRPLLSLFVSCLYS